LVCPAVAVCRGLADNSRFRESPPSLAGCFCTMSQAKPFKIKYEVYPEDGIFVARCLNLDVSSDGATEEEALENLREAIELYVERNVEALHAAADAEDEEAGENDEFDDEDEV